MAMTCGLNSSIDMDCGRVKTGKPDSGCIAPHCAIRVTFRQLPFRLPLPCTAQALNREAVIHDADTCMAATFWRADLPSIHSG
jgi:hypothetical protein